MTRQPISFRFSTHDPSFYTKEVIVNDEPYISHAFVQTPIYDEVSGSQIGYKVSDDYVQQVNPSLYAVRLSNTYFLETGTISWEYGFKNTTPSYFYPVNIPAVSTITAGTGDFYGATGTVRLYPTSDGVRHVQITFDS